MNDEKVDKVLEFSIKVQTNTGKEKIIRLSNINGHIDSSLSIKSDDDDDGVEMKLKLHCLGYTMEIIDV